MPVDYSNAITAGVFKWLDANQESVLKIVQEAIQAETRLVMSHAVDLTAAALMTKFGEFLEANRNDFITGTAAAIAMNYQAKMHPLPRNSE